MCGPSWAGSIAGQSRAVRCSVALLGQGLNRDLGHGQGGVRRCLPALPKQGSAAPALCFTLQEAVMAPAQPDFRRDVP